MDVKFVKNGLIDYLISFKMEEHGYESIQLLSKLIILKEKIKQNEKIMPLDILTAENIY